MQKQVEARTVSVERIRTELCQPGDATTIETSLMRHSGHYSEVDGMVKV